MTKKNASKDSAQTSAKTYYQALADQGLNPEDPHNRNFPPVNSATTGFLREMLDKNFGLYIVIGYTATGKTTTMKNYIKSSPIDRLGSVITENQFEYHPLEVNRDSLTTALSRRSPFIIMDECSTTKLLQDALMISTLSNVGAVLHYPSVADLIERFKTDKDLQFGSRSMFDRVKGITLCRSESLDGNLKRFRESLAVNDKNRDSLLEASKSELPDLIARQINIQGRATIAQQLKSLQGSN